MNKLDLLLTDKQFISLQQYITSEERDFNLFQVLRYSDYEIRHSNVIGWLLDPMGSHGIGNYFLKEFLSICFSSDIAFKQAIELLCSANDINVFRESVFNIDIFINSDSAKVCLAIENKFGSSESHGQTARYRAQVEQEYPDHERLYVFLTPNGVQAQDELWKSQRYWNILPILVQTQNRSNNIEVKLFLKHYTEMIDEKIRIWSGNAAILAREIANRYCDIFILNIEKCQEMELKVIQTIEYIKNVAGFNSNSIADIIEPLLVMNGFIVGRRGYKFPNLWLNFHSQKLMAVLKKIAQNEKTVESAFSITINPDTLKFHLSLYGKSTAVKQLIMKYFGVHVGRKTVGYQSFIESTLSNVSDFISQDGKADLSNAEKLITFVKGETQRFDEGFCDKILNEKMHENTI